MRISNPGEFALFVGFFGTLITLIAGPIGKAVAHRLRFGKSPTPDVGLTSGEMASERIAALEERVETLEAERVELSERLDFAERMLTQASTEQRALPEGRGP